MITYMSISRNYLGYSIKLKVLLTPPILVLGTGERNLCLIFLCNNRKVGKKKYGLANSEESVSF